MRSDSVQSRVTHDCITIVDASVAQNDDTNRVVQEMMMESVQELKTKSSLQ